MLFDRSGRKIDCFKLAIRTPVLGFVLDNSRFALGLPPLIGIHEYCDQVITCCLLNFDERLLLLLLVVSRNQK